MRVAAQIVTASPKMTVTIPDTLNLGISGIAGSPANNVRAGQSSMIIPLGATLPWIISPGPWDTPPAPAKMPRIEATAIVIHPLNLRRVMLVTNAVRAMIEPNRRTRRVQSSKFLHPAQFIYSHAYQGYLPIVNLLPDLMRNDIYLFDPCTNNSSLEN